MSYTNILKRQWTDIGGGLEASYDDSKYVDIRMRTIANDHTNPNKIFASEEALQKALMLFPNKGFNVGDRVVLILRAIPTANQPETILPGMIVTVRRSRVERLVINHLTGKQEKQISEERTYDVITDDDKEHVYDNFPEICLKYESE